MVRGRSDTGHAGASDAVSVPRGRENYACAVCQGVSTSPLGPHVTLPHAPSMRQKLRKDFMFF